MVVALVLKVVMVVRNSTGRTATITVHYNTLVTPQSSVLSITITPCTLYFHRASFQTEFDMSLTDWSSEAVITPRAMSFLFTGSAWLAFTQRSHRGTSTFAYRWSQGGSEDGKVREDRNVMR